MENLPIDLIVIVMAALTALTAAFVVWRGFFYKSPVQDRLKSIAQHRDELRKKHLDDMKKDKQGKGSDLVKQAAKKLKEKRGTTGTKADTKSVKALLMQAGYRGKDAPEIFALFKLIMPFVFGAAAAFYVLFMAKNMSMMMSLVLCAGGAGFGFLAPGIYIKNKAMKRIKDLRKALPDALDLLVICTEAGLSINQALNRVVEEIGRASPVVAEELGLLAVELNFLDDRRAAYVNLMERTGMDEFKAISNTVMQAEKYGTPVSQALKVLTNEFRTERLLKAEEKAARLPALMTVPMIVFILPTLFIVLIGPAILRTIDAFSNM